MHSRLDVAAIIVGAGAASMFWSCGSRPAQHDAGFPEDAVPLDAVLVDARPDTGRPPVWEHPWDVALGALTVRATACPDWEDVTQPPALADDPTPRELWRFRVADDLMGMSFGANLWRPSLHPDQRTVLSHGPDEDVVIAIRDGRIVGRRDDVEVDGFFVFAPDGTAFARRNLIGYGEEEDILQRIVLHEEPTRVRIEVLPGYAFERGVYGEAVVVAPGGRVFTEARTLEVDGSTLRVFALCRGDAVLWEREMVVRPNRATGVVMRVDASGRLHVSVTTNGESFGRSGHQQSTWLFSLDGELLDVMPEEPPPSEEPTLFEEVGLLGDTRAVFTQIGERLPVLGFGAADVTLGFLEGGRVPRYLLASDEAIWTETLRGMTRHFAGEANEISFGDDTKFAATLPDPDGGALVTLYRVPTESSPAEILSSGRLNASGEFLWQLPMRTIGGEPLHANDGVLYIVETNHVSAWQLDFLPMPHACLSPRFGCNAQRDGWVRPALAEPATLGR